MTNRDEILNAVKHVINLKNRNEFTVPEVLFYMLTNDIPYNKNIVTTQITSRLCANSINTEHNDFERIKDGFYRLKSLEFK